MAVVDGLCDDLCRGPGSELDDAGGHTCFCEDLMDDIVGIGGGGRRFPDHYVSD